MALVIEAMLNTESVGHRDAFAERPLAERGKIGGLVLADGRGDNYAGEVAARLQAGLLSAASKCVP